MGAPDGRTHDLAGGKRPRSTADESPDCSCRRQSVAVGSACSFPARREEVLADRGHGLISAAPLVSVTDPA